LKKKGTQYTHPLLLRSKTVGSEEQNKRKGKKGKKKTGE
jgi:hypothetical protein